MLVAGKGTPEVVVGTSTLVQVADTSRVVEVAGRSLAWAVVDKRASVAFVERRILLVEADNRPRVAAEQCILEAGVDNSIVAVAGGLQRKPVEMG